MKISKKKKSKKAQPLLRFQSVIQMIQKLAHLIDMSLLFTSDDNDFKSQNDDDEFDDSHLQMWFHS